MNAPLKAPFPYFGGKSRVSGLVWDAMGEVDGWLEPFGGSLAITLGNPHPHLLKQETVADLDGFVANFWRAVKADPEAVAECWAGAVTKEVYLSTLADTGFDRALTHPGFPITHEMKH